ncbi:hypothetical protein [Candidatus Uabimicrobium sp. HlEnr_7]|uniref:DUF6909 family protein n=1 Tax=Candidatus Uabimicrobium helgolandensis TaxID=3095367 RepID=UPI003556F088
MQELNRSQKARFSIRAFKVIADALLLRGYFKPVGASGQKLVEALSVLSPEIYGVMNDPQRVELSGLVYIMDRLPKGIEQCTRYTFSAAEGLQEGFETIMPLKRRRNSYRVNGKEMCFEITRGQSEIYDILTHITFLGIEMEKIRKRGYDEDGKTQEWIQLEEIVTSKKKIKSLDQEIWNLSKIVGATFEETKKAYLRLESSGDYNNGLFQIIYWLGKRAWQAHQDPSEGHLVIFTPSLEEMMGKHLYAEKWATNIKQILQQKKLIDRPLHIISSNLHSIRNLLSCYAVGKSKGKDVYETVKFVKGQDDALNRHALKHGMIDYKDTSKSHIDCQIIDATKIDFANLHPDVKADEDYIKKSKPVLLVMDYAFGEQAFEVMDELLKPYQEQKLNVSSISVMGKAGILPGKKGDIMLPTAHIFEGNTDTYSFKNRLQVKDFTQDITAYRGPMITVLGTSLQNRDVLNYFLESSWKAIGLEMEGGHYQKAIQSAMIRQHIKENVALNYAYYASDNPLQSGQTLASGGMGDSGIRPTYTISNVMLHKILTKPKS